MRSNNERFKPTLEQEEFEHLHTECDKARRNSKIVRVSKQAVERLLMDHANLLTIAEIEDDT